MNIIIALTWRTGFTQISCSSTSLSVRYLQRGTEQFVPSMCLTRFIITLMPQLITVEIRSR